MDDKTVSVVIPTLNAGKEIDGVLNALLGQTVVPMEIVVIDSSSDDNTVKRAKTHPLVRVIVIDRSDFDHGGTRNMGLEKTTGEFVLFMTQDALPADDRMIENLLHPFEDVDVAIVSGRQLPKDDCRPFERLVRQFNYPPESNKRTESDIELIGIKAFFSSDVCCMYRRASLARIGGIPHPCFTNEDMLAAARCLRAGMSVCYAGCARVYHSHNLTLREEYRRNKLIGSFLAKNRRELSVRSEFKEGARLFRFVIDGLVESGQYFEIARFCIDCFARVLGNRVGRKSEAHE